MGLFLKATTKTKAVWRVSKSFRCSCFCSCYPRSSLQEYNLPDPRFSIALFLEVALALFIHILVSSGISLAPWRACSSWIELYSCFPLQVVMKGDRAAIHRTRRAGNRERERERGRGGGEDTQASQEKTLGKCQRLILHAEGKSLTQTPSPLILPCFL